MYSHFLSGSSETTKMTTKTTIHSLERTSEALKNTSVSLESTSEALKTTSPAAAALPSSTIMDGISTGIRSFSYKETTLDVLDISSSQITLEQHNTVTQKEKMRPFSIYDASTRVSSFYYIDKVTTTPGYASHSEQLEIIHPVVIVSILIFTCFVCFIVYRKYTCICAKKQYDQRLELASYTYRSSITELQETTDM